MIMEPTNVDTLAFARRIVTKYLAYLHADLTSGGRPTVNRKVARARFLGLCDAADALGLAMTPDHLHTVVVEHVGHQIQTRPGYRAMSNHEQQDWDTAAAKRIAVAMGWASARTRCEECGGLDAHDVMCGGRP
jgi:hypothetical protein